MNCEGMLTKINLVLNQKKYKETRKKINEFLSYLGSLCNITNSEKHYFWACYLKLAICDRREDNYKNAIKEANKALLYCTIESEKYSCYWLLGICYKYLNDFPKALYYYDKCIEFYSKIKNINELVQVLKCKALLLHDEKLLQDAIEVYENYAEKDINTYNDLKKTLKEISIYNNAESKEEIHKIINLATYKALSNKVSK